MRHPIRAGLQVVLVVLTVACPVAVGAQDTARMDEVAEARATTSQFMGAVLVAAGDRLLLDRGYGFANIEWQVPASPITKFRIGSLTKQFTAAAVLLLEERGRLSVSDPIRRHLPDLPGSWSAVTIEHLLTHTAGIPNYTAFPTYMASSVTPVTIEQLVAVFRDKPLEFVPGSNMRYSNSGYATLGMLIEKVSGASYAQFVRDNIFVPLGMSDSGYDSHAEVIARRASGYAPGPSRPVNAPYLDMSVPHAAGALYSTTHDLLKWTRALHGGKLLSPASLAKMTKPARNNYAFGLTVVNAGERQVIQHGGGINGFSSFLAYYPDSGITVAVLSNVAVGPVAQSLARDLAALAHGETVTLQSERKEITLPAGTLADYVGTYALGAGGIMTVRLDGAQLTAQLGGQPRFPLFAESERKFFLKAVDAQIEFVRGDDKAVSHLVLHQNGNSIKGTRTAPGTTTPAVR